MQLDPRNSAEFDKWSWDRRDHDLCSVKGPAPPGATFEDGTPILTPVNVAWKDTTTGEVFKLKYLEE
jgi:hypothetical protein